MRCGADAAGSTHVTVDGARVCNPCFDEMLEAADPEAPVFRCGVCGAPTSIERIDYMGGIHLCPVCAGTADPSEVAEASNGSASARASTPPSLDVKHLEHLPPLSEFVWPKHMLREVTCPHCWHTFPPQEILHVSQHADLLGDPIAGDHEQLRFKASRFDRRGSALDLRDLRCSHMACPHCHLIVPRSLLQMEPMILSIIGAPASGKSHFLAAMTWEMRRILAERFSIAFNDADPDFNRALNEYEEMLFLPPDQNSLVTIRKTELEGELYRQITIGQQTVTLPRPFLFTMRYGEQADPSLAGRVRLLCMYDNAGEHFQPGMDTTAAPGTQHLARSRVLMFVFDPTQHPRLREQCRQVSDDPQLQGTLPTSRQETILLEAVARIRRHIGIDSHSKHDKPLLVLLSKADIWGKLAGIDVNEEPLVWQKTPAGDRTSSAVDLQRIKHTSAKLRQFLLTHAPNVITAAEDSFRHVIYMPISSLGAAPGIDAATGMLGIPSKDVKPKWVTAPLLFIFSSVKTGGIPAAQVTAQPEGISRGV